MTRSAESGQRGHYPYGADRLVPDWSDRKARALALAATLAVSLALLGRSLNALSTIDDFSLRVLFPALLAIVLAFAPRPTVRLGQIAKDLTVIGLIASVFAGDLIALMVASYPLLLAASALLSRVALARRLWPELP